MKKLFLLVVVLLLAACAAPHIEEAGEFTPMAAPMVGRPAPHIEWETAAGEGSLSDLRGQVVLLVFWSPFCPHCLDEMVALKAIQGRYEEDLTVISITSDTTGAWEKVRGEIGFTFFVLTDPEGMAFGAYWIYRGVPVLFVIDQEGIIRARFEGAVPESQIEDELAPLLEP